MVLTLFPRDFSKAFLTPPEKQKFEKITQFIIIIIVIVIIIVVLVVVIVIIIIIIIIIIVIVIYAGTILANGNKNQLKTIHTIFDTVALFK